MGPTKEILECLTCNGFTYNESIGRYVKKIDDNYWLDFITTGNLHCFGEKFKNDSRRIVVLSTFATKQDWNEVVSRVADLDEHLTQVLS